MSELLTQMIENARPVAFHEAGHNVVAAAVGLVPGYLKLFVTPYGTSGESEIDLKTPFRDLEDILAYIPRRIIALYGGCLAQSFDEEGIDEIMAENLLTSSSSDDASKIRENLRISCNIKYRNEDDYYERLNDLEINLCNEAIQGVIQQKDKIKRVAEVVIQKIDGGALTVELSVAEISAA